MVKERKEKNKTKGNLKEAIMSRTCGVHNGRIPEYVSGITNWPHHVLSSGKPQASIIKKWMNYLFDVLFFFFFKVCVCFFHFFFLSFFFISPSRERERERERNITKRPEDPGAREGRTPTGAASAAYLPNDRALASQITQDEKNSVPQTAASSTNRKKKSERTKQKKKWIRFFYEGKKAGCLIWHEKKQRI